MSLTKNWYAIECAGEHIGSTGLATLYVSGSDMTHHWSIDYAWLFETMAEALPVLEAHPGSMLIMVQVETSIHVIGVVG